MHIADLAIICALPEEYDAMWNAIRDPNMAEYKLGPFKCGFGHIKRNGDIHCPVLRVVVLCLKRMGNLASMQATTLLLRDTEPSYVFLVGICGGIPKSSSDYKLGDIVVSDRIYYYEPKKLWPERDENRSVDLYCSTTIEGAYTPSPLIKLASDNIVQPILSLIKTQDLYGNRFRPAIKTGVVCSGEKVIADVAFSEKLLEEKEDVIAVEMEAAGVAMACQDPITPFLVVKAVSDFTDVSEDWRPEQRIYAAEMAAAYTVALATYPFHGPGNIGNYGQNQGW